MLSQHDSQGIFHQQINIFAAVILSHAQNIIKMQYLFAYVSFRRMSRYSSYAKTSALPDFVEYFRISFLQRAAI